MCTHMWRPEEDTDPPSTSFPELGARLVAGKPHEFTCLHPDRVGNYGYIVRARS